MTLSDVIGFFGILVSIVTGIWIILDRFGNLEGRVGRLEDKVDEILEYLKRKKMKRLKHK